MTKNIEEPWIDRLWEKHECFHYTPHSETVSLDGRTIRLLLPDYLPGFTVRAWAEQGDLLFLLFQLDERYGDAFLGAMVVARKTGENTYTTTIWHELFPWALKYLGLA
jgi:hypothetical protein